jgi:GTPase involved in cell partitioning and DNA repair
MAVYKTVRDELSRYGDGSLSDKPELIVLTKADTRSPEEIKRIGEEFKAQGCEVTTVTILGDASVKALQDVIIAALR